MESRRQDAFKRDAFKQQLTVNSNRKPKLQSDPGSSSRTGGRVLVAVDFGTTFSAAAWMRVGAGSTDKKESTDRPLINLVVDWPHQTEEERKVPTVLQYGEDGAVRWGFDYDKELERFQWFKLEQDPNYKAEQLKQAYPPLTRKPENEQQARNLITTYLTLLRGHVEESIRGTYDIGGRKGKTLLKGVPLEYIITVPAMWPESAQSITERCASEAGMAMHGSVKIIAEPEAAGIYALDEIGREVGLAVGDTFVICDAGGGTVDLISYTVTQVEPSPVLEEAAAGTGGLCGSSFLDREFYKWLVNHVLRCPHWTSDHTDTAMETWEAEVKRGFKSAPGHKNIIRCMGIPDDPSLSIKNGRLHMPRSTMKQIFAPVLKQILELVNDQIIKVEGGNRPVNAILLAGGFGKNEYLKESIQALAGEKVKVRRMPDCTTAIVRGALIRGLDEKRSSTTGKPTVTVGSRMARKHYGTTALQRYAHGYHDPQRQRLPGGVDGGQRIEVMRWFVKKNTRVNDFEPMTFPFYYDHKVADAKFNGCLDTINIPIFVCEEDTEPMYPDDESAHKKVNKRLVEVKADLNLIPKDKLIKQKGEDGQWYYKIDFQIVMTRSFANITFKLVHDGLEYGTVDAEWDTT